MADTFLKGKKTTFTFKRYIISSMIYQKKKTLFQVCCCAKISNLIVQDGLPYLSFSNEKNKRYSPKY